jgi:hypothetical protein
VTSVHLLLVVDTKTDSLVATLVEVEGRRDPSPMCPLMDLIWRGGPFDGFRLSVMNCQVRPESFAQLDKEGNRI